MQLREKIEEDRRFARPAREEWMPVGERPRAAVQART